MRLVVLAAAAVCLFGCFLFEGLWDDYTFPEEVLAVPNYDDLDEQVISTTAVAVNNNGIVVGYTGGEFYYRFSKVRIAEVNDRIEIDLSELNIDPDLIEITGMNDINQVVGWYLDNTSKNVTGFVLDVDSDDTPTILNIDRNLYGYQYVEIQPTAINNSGIITGTTGRILDPSFGLPQARVLFIKSDGTSFNDITPENNDAYGEAYDISDNGLITGYAGFMQNQGLVLNRAFVVEID